MKRTRSLILITAALFCILAWPSAAIGAGFDLAATEDLFPFREFENEISFWEKVFTGYESNQVLMHDDRDLRLIYYVKEFDSGIENNDREARRQKKILEEEIKSLKRDLEVLHLLGPESSKLNSRQRGIAARLQALGYETDARTISGLKSRLRYQRGISDKFRSSLVRSGRYLGAMKEIFKRNGLPEDLAYLPHVESSFDYNAYSKAGAAGVWQFTRGTGRSYLMISGSIDERLDPIRATEAAARLLKDNFQALGSWALTMTSYNYGRNGMLRAKEQFGTDFRRIVDNHNGRYFGFASRNFYAEFLTALKVAKNYQEYFGDLQIETPLEFETIRLVRNYDAGYFTSVPGLSPDILGDFNPHINRILNRSLRVIPAGVDVRIPRDKYDAVLAALENAGPSAAKLIASSDGSMRYKVQPGDSLGRIASALETSAGYLQKINGIRDANRIYPGQILLIAPPEREGSEPDPSPGAASSATVYVVRRGDSLSRIARKFKISVTDLQSRNGISNPDSIHPGMKLEIPTS